MNDLTTILISTISAGTPILYALIGDRIGQRAGIISLSVEGSMLVGACIGFGVAYRTQSMFLAVLAAIAAGGFVGLLQAFLSIDRKTNMMASGFVLMFFTQGLTAFYGRTLLDVSFRKSLILAIPLLSRIPVIGPALFSQDVLTYLSFLLPAAAWFILTKTKLGLLICSVGERPEVTRAYGHDPRKIQYVAVIFAGMLAGIGAGDPVFLEAPARLYGRLSLRLGPGASGISPSQGGTYLYVCDHDAALSTDSGCLGHYFYLEEAQHAGEDQGNQYRPLTGAAEYMSVNMRMKRRIL